MDTKRWTRKIFFGGLALATCFILYLFLPEFIPEVGKRVTAVFLFALLFWAFEIIPLYATSLLVVLFLTLLLSHPVDRIGEGLNFFLLPFSSPVIMLFLGGLVLASCASKHSVDRVFMEKMLSKVGMSSHRLVLSLLFISAFFSLFISNTAAAAMMLALVGPILAKIKKGDPLRVRVVLAIAFGAGIGGIGSPIGSPPNAIAIGILQEHGVELNFLSWMLMAIPLAICLILLAAAVLSLFFRSKTPPISFSLKSQTPFSQKGKGVLVIGALMLLLWLSKPIHGISEGIVGLLGTSLFAATGLISIKDFRNIPWHILVMMWGGLALGEAVVATGLIENVFDMGRVIQHEFGLISAFCLLAMLLSSVISNTATANLLLPIALSIDPTGQNLLPITVALACSFSLIFPVSTPPNAIVYGTGIVSVKEMSKPGVVISFLALIIMLLGFEIVIPLAFGPLG